MRLVSFRLSGRFGHFLKAEGGASAMSYPAPPRTAILGMIGAVLGLQKDQPQQLLEPAHIAISGKRPPTFWHRAKLRKDPPALLPKTVKKSQKADKATSPEKASLIDQEWLFNPAYTLWVALPEPYQQDFENRLDDRRWHFQPCLGVSELAGNLQYLAAGDAGALPSGAHSVHTVFPRDAAELDVDAAFQKGVVVHAMRMPRAVTSERVFRHAAYFMERDARPVPVNTKNAVEFDGKALIFL